MKPRVMFFVAAGLMCLSNLSYLYAPTRVRAVALRRVQERFPGPYLHSRMQGSMLNTLFVIGLLSLGSPACSQAASASADTEPAIATLERQWTESQLMSSTIRGSRDIDRFSPSWKGWHALFYQA